MIGYARMPGEAGPTLRAMDLPPFLTVVFLSVVSFLHPDTGTLDVLGRTVPRGYVVGTEYLAGLLPVWLLMRLERRYGGRILGFFRTFYPQLLITPFFMESILLSSRVLGGVSHDAFFAAMDERIFGFHPYLVFYKAFESFPRFNELMFGAYFTYYVMIASVLWIPWLKGDRKETERAVFVYFAMTMVVTVWYVFFRVQGPKYWYPELRSNWYDNFKGFLFVNFFQKAFDRVTLSGAAFPSSHVLFTVFCILLANRWDKRLLAFYLPMLALILMATVYIYAHYVTDGIAALILAPLLYLGASKLYEPLRRLFLPPGAEGRRADTPASGGPGR